MRRTVLITNANLLSLLSLGDFLLRWQNELAAVFVTTRLPGQRSNLAGLWRMWRRSGWQYTHFKLLTNRLLPMRLRRAGLPGDLRAFVARLERPPACIEAPDINDPAMIERVRSFEPDILLSFSATTRFCDALIQVPRRVAINAHYALLPGYAGLSPYFWYLRNGEPECGVTLHVIEPRLDAGPIIEQRRFSLAGLRTVLGVLLEQTACVSPMLDAFYSGRTHESQARPQDLSRRSYYRHPTRADVRALRARGCRFYDAADLAAVAARVRALAGQVARGGA